MADNVSEVQDRSGNASMNTVSWIMAILLLIVLFPLLPVFLLYLAVDRLLGEAEGEGETTV
jgi:hypothetical protein